MKIKLKVMKNMLVKNLMNDVRVMKRTGESVTLADFKASKDNDAAWLLSYSSDNDFNHLILLEFANIKDEELQDLYDDLLNRQETLMVTRTANGKGVYSLIYINQDENFLHMQSAYGETLRDKYKRRIISHRHIDKRVFYSNNQKQIWKEDERKVTAFDWDENPDKDEKDVSGAIYFCMKKVEEEVGTRYIDYIEATEMIYRCASAEKYGILYVYDFCKTMLISRGSNSYYTHAIDEFYGEWKQAINTNISETLYNCRETWYWWQLAGYEKKEIKTNGKIKNTTFKYKVEKDENGNITKCVAEKINEKEVEPNELRRCDKPGFAYIARDEKPFEL